MTIMLVPKRVSLICLLIAACVALGAQPVSAAVIFEMTRFDIGGGAITPPTQPFLAPISTANDQFGSNLWSIFKFTTLTQDSVGHTFVANRQNEAQFFLVAQSLTDGKNNWITIINQGGAQHNFFANVPGGNGIDLGGFRLDSVSMTLVSRIVEIPGSDPNHDGQWQDETRVYHYVFEGARLPEPSSLVLAALGLMGMIGWSWRKHARQLR